DQVARNPQTNPFHQHGRHITFGPAALSREAAILHIMPRRGESLAITALQRHTAIAGVEQFAILNAMTDTTIHNDAPVSHVLEHAIRDPVACATVDFDCAAPAGLESRALKNQ